MAINKKRLNMAILAATAIVAMVALCIAAAGSGSSDASPQTVTITIDDNGGTGSVQYLDDGVWTDFGESRSFENGTVLKIKAVSTMNDKFVWWTGDIKAVGEEYELTVGDSPVNITAKFVEGVSTQWTELQISVFGSGAIQFEIEGTFVDIPTGGITYPVDEQITLKPREIGSTFIWWTGDLSGTQSEQKMDMDTDKFVGAEFYTGTTYTLEAYTTTSSSQPGISEMQYWQNGAYQKFPASNDYTITVPENTEIEIRLNITDGVLIGAWASNDSNLSGTGLVKTTVVSNDTWVYACVNHNEVTHLRVYVEDHGSSGAVEYKYSNSDDWYTWVQSNNDANGGSGVPVYINVSIMLRPAGSGTFVWWTGDKSGTDQSMEVTNASSYDITAVFAVTTYEVSATVEKFANNGDGGKVQYRYSGVWTDFPAGNTLTVPSDIGTIDVRAVASTANKNVFLWWTGDINGPVNIQSLTVSGNKNIKAVFNSNNSGDNRNIVANVSGNGSVEVQNAGIWGSEWQAFPVGVPMVVPNDSSTNSMGLRAVAGTSVNNKFVWWTGDLRGTEISKTLGIDGNKTVTATFSANTQSVNFAVSGSGKITYLLDGSYEDAPTYIDVPKELGTLSLKAVPGSASGNEFVWWTGDVSGTDADVSLDLSGSAKSVTALFSSDLSTVTAVTSEGSMKYILDGKVLTFPAGGLRAPNGFTGIQLRVDGAVPTGWMLNGDSLGINDNPLGITVSSNQEYEATFIVAVLRITVTVGPNGSSDPSEDFDALEGSDIEFKFKPDDGFMVSDVLVDGVSVMSHAGGNRYALNNIAADHTVEVVFDQAVRVYIIMASADSGADISPSGPTETDFMANRTFSFSAKPGREIKNILIDGQVRNDLIGTQSYTFREVVMNHTIDILTEDRIITLTVEIIGGDGSAEYKVGNGGFMKYGGRTAIPFGSEVSVQVSPGDGFVFRHWLDNGTVSGTDEIYSIHNVGESVYLGAVVEPEEPSDFLVWIAVIVLAAIAVLVLAFGAVRYIRARNS
ncbi:MAG: hypothetical protein LBJ20_03505 [Candidatus Methanoplasma sp.]|jgi:hypothetical protein|nr:hypothetical protein [Candidatus Methanoplasma sp.]